MPPLMVTGGCGFIGSNFIRHLLATDPNVAVVNFDALTYAGNLANPADLLVRAYNHTFGLPAVITRCSNNYGPYQFPEKLIPLFVSNLLEDKQVPVYGDGQQIRDWIRVLDHARGVEMAWRAGKPGEV